jgi:hypothetical protein
VSASQGDKELIKAVAAQIGLAEGYAHDHIDDLLLNVVGCANRANLRCAWFATNLVREIRIELSRKRKGAAREFSRSPEGHA